ncbi:MAG: esterase-like activity of phytase family protein [Thermomicrobiales bacterium]
MQTLETDLMFEETMVGGLSGIVFDATTNQWIALSYDRSDFQPARFYSLDIPYTAEAIEPVTVESVVTLLQANGEPYPSAIVGGNIPDPESIRIDPFVAQPSLPDVFDKEAGETAEPRENLVFEEITFSVDGQSIWLSLEGPLYQEGSTATVEHGAVTRITQLDRSGEMLGQFTYELEPIPGPADAFSRRV